MIHCFHTCCLISSQEQPVGATLRSQFSDKVPQRGLGTGLGGHSQDPGIPYLLFSLSPVPFLSSRKQDSNTNSVHPWQPAVQTPTHTDLLVSGRIEATHALGTSDILLPSPDKFCPPPPGKQREGARKVRERKLRT